MVTKRKLVAMSLVLALMCIIPSGFAFAADAPSDWAVTEVNAAIEANLVPAQLQSNYRQAITRADFTALAVTLYEGIKGEITGRATFVDTNDVYVEKAAFIGVVAGVGDNKFDPNATLTREQAATMLSRLSDLLDKPFPIQAPTFADNNRISGWAFDNVGRVQAAGIMGGVGNNTFDPLAQYTREQSIITIKRTYDAVINDSTTNPPPEITQPPEVTVPGSFPAGAEGATGWARAKHDCVIGNAIRSINISSGELVPYEYTEDKGVTFFVVFYDRFWRQATVADWELLN